MANKLLLTIFLGIFMSVNCSMFAQNHYQKGKVFFKIKDTNNKARYDLMDISQLLKLNGINSDIYGLITLNQPFVHLRSRTLINVYVLNFSKDWMAESVVTHLNRLNFIEYAEKIPEYTLFNTPDDIDSRQWYLDSIHAIQAWSTSVGNAGITIAIVDDAVLTSHEDLSASIWSNPNEIPLNGVDDDNNGYIDDINGWDVSENDNNPNPPFTATNNFFSHGTHVAGIASATTNNSIGIASVGYGTRIISVKCKPDMSAGSSLPDAYLGVSYAIAAGARVISMSWGGPAYSITYQNLFEYAHNQGIVLVAAAGNSNTDLPMYPASYEYVISVGATDINDFKAGFSNYGTTIDVMAPGKNIWSTVAGSVDAYEYKDGTSMACPLVSGLCGLMLSYAPSSTPEQIEFCLESGCVNIDAVNPLFAGQLGAGRINAAIALICLQGNLSADFSSNFSFVCAGDSVVFTDLTTGFPPDSWQWTFPGGNPSVSFLQNPVIFYSVSGIYAVTLIATNSYSSDTVTKTAFIAVGPPSATITGTGLDTICKGQFSSLVIELTGNKPWTITYSDGTDSITLDSIFTSPYIVSVKPVVNTTYTLISMNDALCNGVATGSATVTPVNCCSSYLGKEYDNWYFGSFAGVSFTSGNPIVLLDGKINTSEGSASISDINGNLLFYTDGVTVWDANHDTMPNGKNLMGSDDATQSAMILKKPGSMSQYYLFTTQAWSLGSQEFRYSVADMNLNGGLGDIIDKNTFIEDEVSEKIAVLSHPNGTDYWLVIHKRNSNEYYSYLISSSGLSAPVITTIGTNDNGQGGYLKFSHDGKKLAAGIYSGSSKVAEILDFDNLTGQLSNLITISGMASYAYGLEFSPNNQLFYVADLLNNFIYQYDLSSGDSAIIVASQQTIGTSSSFRIGALLLGRDEKIYLARLKFNSSYLGVINVPNATGMACDYIDDGFYLGGNIPRYGLPNIPKILAGTLIDAQFTFADSCFLDSVNFTNTSIGDPDSVFWNFGDTASGTNNTSREFSPKHLFSSVGSFPVILIAYKGCSVIPDTIVQKINIVNCCSGLPGPSANFIISDTVICRGDSVMLTNTSTGNSLIFNWDFGNGDFSDSVFPDYRYQIPGTYLIKLTISDSCGNVDSVTKPIVVVTDPYLILPADTIICEGDTATINIDAISDYSYRWSGTNGISDSTIANPFFYPVNSTTYYLTVFDPNGCVSKDSILISVFGNSTVAIITGPNNLCEGDTAILTAAGGTIYLWNTGDTTSFITITDTGTYMVIISNGICSDSASISVSPTVVADIFGVTTICDGDIITLTASGGNNYLWSTGETTSYITVNPSADTSYLVTLTTIVYTVTVSTGSCIDTASVTIIILPPPLISACCTDTIIQGELVSIEATGGVAYSWLPDDGTLSCTNCSKPFVYPLQNTTYIVTGNDSNGCFTTDSVLIVIDESCEVFVPNAFSPNGDEYNDILFVRGNCIKEMNFIVYNRWGQKVFVTTDITAGWDGTYRDRPLDPGVFVFYLRYKLFHGNENNFLKGNITLIK
ncbi:MAG: S8 family serine peptidase [Bacteroidetes bacterium]|nr:S8 family serine peptidase [Bacteroidota bacterium]